jgi:hypothetical protein
MLRRIKYTIVGPTVENACRDGQQFVLQPCATPPDICVACGNPAYGNVLHKKFPDNQYLWLWPTPLEIIAYFLYPFVDKYLFDFAFCSNCTGSLLASVRIDDDLAVFKGASQRFLESLPLITTEVASEKNRDWIDRKFRTK